ncbi:putative zinc finger protein zpr1 [Phaeomoniella chlamydospora]|uniref:Putative zinc finger protein zpr1 n=1 Tax=Phaeomoniella chlamydospora TaxID=158046 RepID=A0A0G2GW64_PHACM|nr:putative zinc finger protein zpr1 [Phaeomoniella chlamydospora]
MTDVQQDTQLKADDTPQVTEVESLCMRCHENGMTRLLLFYIPYFREVILSSFSCEHCGHQDNSVRPAGRIQEKGSKYTLRVDMKKDLERQVVRNDSAILRIEDLDLEMPKGESQLTNIEGILLKIITEFEVGQPARKESQPEIYEALQQIIEKLKKMMDASALPFVISINDPSGNSFIEPYPDDKDHKYVRQDYLRTPEQNEELGLAAETDDPEAEAAPEGLDDSEIVNGVVYTLHETCPACSKPCVVNMQRVQIPHFKEVFIIATNCSHCGYRTSDVKTGGEIPEKGKNISLKVQTVEDLSRDLLKSETCGLRCPEIDLQVEPGTLGGRFTTVEGLLAQVREQLHGQVYDVGGEGEGVSGGDSMPTETKTRWDSFFKKLDAALKVETHFTIILEDPLGNSYIQSLSDTEVDPQIHIEEYERTFEENDHLGLNDMKVEGYEQDSKKKDETKA